MKRQSRFCEPGRAPGNGRLHREDPDASTGKDWNEALVAGLKKDAVHQLLAAAEVRKPTLEGAPLFK